MRFAALRASAASQQPFTAAERGCAVSMSADDVVSGLQQAKEHLKKAKSDGLQVASIMATARDSVGDTLGRAGLGSPLVAEMHARQQAMLAKVMAIDAFLTRIDAAIARARDVGGGAAESGGPP